MKVKFTIEEGNEISTKLIDGQEELEFKYIDFVQKLYKGKELEVCEFNGEIDEYVKTLLSGMVQEINEIVISNSFDEQENENR